MVSLRQALIKLASDNPEIRKYLIPVLRKDAMEFPTEDALKKYLDEHPGADKAKHTIVEKKDTSGGTKGKPSKHQDALNEAAESLGKPKKEIAKMWNEDHPHFEGTMGHRFEDGFCVYCGRPKNYKPYDIMKLDIKD